MNKLLATLIAGAFVATSTIALAQTTAPATTTTPPAASSGSMKADSMNHDGMTKKSAKKAKKAKKKAAVAKEDQMIKGATHSSNSAVKAAPATGGAAMNSGMKAETKGK
jgi:pentapeptide MXKDX repeat protein